MKLKIQELTDNWPTKHQAKVLAPCQIAKLFLDERNYVSSEGRSIVYWKGDFYEFDGTHYRQLALEDFRSDLVRWMQEKPELWKYTKANSVSSVILNIVAVVKLPDALAPSTWIPNNLKAYKNCINLKNGIFYLDGFLRDSTPILWKHSQEFFSTACLPFNFDLNGKCPTWTSFMNQVQPDPSVRSLIQEWFGYNLIFDTRFHRFMLFYGEGANGKSVCCVVLRTLLGTANVSAVGLDAFSSTRTFPLAATVGKLANIVEELNEVDRTAEGELKKYVSGGLMTVERKHRDPFEFAPSARLTFASNVLPRFCDRSDGIWRRLLLVQFNVQIRDEKAQDKRLVDSEFWEQSGELPGIFMWALEGLARLIRQNGFTEPATCQEATQKFKKDSNPAKSFLADYCEFNAGASISSRTLFEKYADFAKSNGHHSLSEPIFAREVARVFPEAKKSANAVRIGNIRGHVWYNIRLID